RAAKQFPYSFQSSPAYFTITISQFQQTAPSYRESQTRHRSCWVPPATTRAVAAAGPQEAGGTCAPPSVVLRRGLCIDGRSGGGEKAKGADWTAGGDADGTRQEAQGTTWEGLTEEEAAAAIAGPIPPTRRPLIRYGVVSSDRMHKTVMVKVPYQYIVPVYGKRLTRYSKIMAHDETNSLRIGDHVGIAHVHQRYSKRKAHKVVEVRRVVPRLDDENALPPLKKAEQPQQA
ncbi:unnamed protein product, partial [Sphacelaria rigidula]